MTLLSLLATPAVDTHPASMKMWTYIDFIALDLEHAHPGNDDFRVHF